MRHKKARRQFNRFTSWRRATLLSLARSILIYQSIHTTKTKAMAARPLIEKLIGLAKENTLAAKRKAHQLLNDHQLVKVLFSEIGPRFSRRTGGYVRVLHLGPRRGDGAEIALLELTEIKKKEIKKPKKEEKAKEEKKPESTKDHPPETQARTPPTAAKRPPKKFLGGIKNIFKKERDSL